MPTATGRWTWSSYEENFIYTSAESGRRLDFNDVIVFYDKIPYVFIVLVLLSDNVFYLCKVNVWHGYVWVVCIWVWKKIIDIAYNKGPENWVNFCVNMLTFTN